MTRCISRKIPYTQVKPLPEDHELYREDQTFRRELPRLLAEGKELKFVLIKGDEIIGIYETMNEGILVGREKFGMQPFMVKLILGWELVVFTLPNLSRSQLNLAISQLARKKAGTEPNSVPFGPAAR